MEYITSYKPLIDSSYKESQLHDEGITKAEFILQMFHIYPYESGENANFLAEKVLNVIKAITKRETFEMHEEDTCWYLAVCHFSQIQNKITWGTSIRGAYWDTPITLDACCIFYNGNQILNKEFTGDNWGTFTLDLYNFYYNETIGKG